MENISSPRRIMPRASAHCLPDPVLRSGDGFVPLSDGSYAANVSPISGTPFFRLIHGAFPMKKRSGISGWRAYLESEFGERFD
jgi:hypothetical protein